MPARTSRPRSLANSSVIVSLCLLICLASVTRVPAQKKPPILTSDKISAYDTAAIKTLETDAAKVDNPAAAKLARNKLVAIGVEQVDTAFNDYRTKTRKSTDRLNFLFDFLEIGASSTISIINGGLRAKSLIGEGLSLFQGTRSAFNKDFRFLEKQILFDKMVALRAQKLTAIYGKLNNEVTQYPWEQARSELRDYFFAGTIDEALSGISRETGAQAQTAEEALKIAKETAGVAGPVSAAEVKADNEAAAKINPIEKKYSDAQTKLDAENAKPADQRSQTNIDAANAEQTAALNKMKAIFQGIVDSPVLEPLLATISKSSPGNEISADYKAKIEGSLTKAREKTGSFQDYQKVLGSLLFLVGRIVDKNPIPNNELQRILAANQ